MKMTITNHQMSKKNSYSEIKIQSRSNKKEAGSDA